MRLSELIKNQGTVRKPPAVWPKTPPPVLPKVPPVPAKPPAVTREEMEKKIREKLEQEFQAKVEKAEAEARGLRDEKAEQERKRLQEKERMFEESQKKLEQLMEDLEKSKDRLALWARQSADEETSRRLTEERTKLERELSQDKDSTNRVIEELKQKIKQQELELKTKTEIPVPPPAAKAIPPVAPRRTLPPRKEEIPVYDAEAEAQGKRIYEELLASLQGVFDSVAKSEALEIGSLQHPVEELIDLASRKEAELINVVLEPYPDAHYFSYHAVNCAVLSIVLGLDFELSREELKELALAALLHDVGLVNIRENLDYPKRLTTEIQKEVLAHPERGSEILKPYASELVLTAVRQHHEAANGKGYPHGLEAKDVHLYGKIIHVVDSFEALTHHRPYRKRSLEVSQAMKEIIEQGRGIYDAAVLKSIMGRVGLYPVTSLVELSNRQIARVLRQNRQFPLSPVVRVEFDEFGNKVKESSILNLAEHQIVHIVGSLREVSSYSKEQQIVHKKAPPSTRWIRLLDFAPSVVIISILLLLLLLVWKI